jgi:hypothetical protein
VTGQLGSEVAEWWLRSVVPSWVYRYLMPAGWVAALGVSIWSDDQPCSVSDPTVCGPDRTFSLVMIVCMGSLVLWWRQPRLAAGAGLLFLMLELQYDDVAGARTAWTVYASACAVVLAWLTLSRRRQRALSDGLTRSPVVVQEAKAIGFTLRLGVACALVVVGMAALGIMRWQEQEESDHLRRADEQTAVVGDFDDDGNLRLELADGSRRAVGVVGGYEKGSRIAVLVDPADSGWLRLTTERADYTPWYTVAGGAWTLTILLVLRELRTRKARPRRSWSATGVPVRITPDSSTDFAILPADGGNTVLGFVPVDLDDEDADGRLIAAFDLLDEDGAEAPRAARREWERTLRRYQGDAVFVSSLVEGEWPTILIGDAVLRPAGPFRAPRRMPWGRQTLESLPPTGSDTGAEGAVDPAVAQAPGSGEQDNSTRIEPAQDIPPLPWSVPLEPVPWWARPALAGLLVAAPVAIWLLVFRWDDWGTALGVAVFGSSVVHYLAGLVFLRVIASATEIRIRTGSFEEVVSWRTVDSVELSEDQVSLETGDGWHTIGGLAKGQSSRVAAVFEVLRLRARGGPPIPSARRRFGPWLAVKAAYVVGCTALLILAHWNPF